MARYIEIRDPILYEGSLEEGLRPVEGASDEPISVEFVPVAFTGYEDILVNRVAERALAIKRERGQPHDPSVGFDVTFVNRSGSGLDL